jgi:hypothetical protein
MPKFLKAETDLYYIMKVDDCSKNEDLVEYLKQIVTFRGNMDMMGNSIEVILNKILSKIDIVLELTLGRKIDDLIQKLRRFNENWKITKHGITLMGETISEMTFFKDDGIYIFDKKEIDEIKHEFNHHPRCTCKNP